MGFVILSNGERVHASALNPEELKNALSRSYTYTKTSTNGSRESIYNMHTGKIETVAKIKSK